MKKDRTLVKQLQMSIGIYLFSIFMLCVLLFSIGCNGSYIAGYSIDPDTTKHNSTIFNEIVDSDSSVHWYVKVYDGELWCYYHNQYEIVKHVRR